MSRSEKAGALRGPREETKELWQMQYEILGWTEGNQKTAVKSGRPTLLLAMIHGLELPVFDECTVLWTLGEAR